MFYHQDTIAAISTALGEGAIGIVRLSGPDAINMTQAIFKDRDLNEVDSHTINYGHIISPETDEILDEVMVSVMKAPRTYTREDIIEINCHGGVVAVQRILEAVLRQGARLAEPGEFTQRAFLNGRIDLSQAEAVMDVIEAKTNRAMTASMQQLQGSLSKSIRALRQEMLETLAVVEVTIDYPEYDDVEEKSTRELNETAHSIKSKIERILNQAQQGRLFREGIQTVIIGRPNVGKSSLLNHLAGQERAIVTDIAGTTRDVIEEFIQVRGVPLKLVDTAGIRQTEEVVEQIGVERSRELMTQADLIILVINQAEPLESVDFELLEATQTMQRIIVMNKQDLPSEVSQAELLEYATEDEIIATSLLEDEGIESLEDQIEQRFFGGQLESADMNYLLNTRHTELLHQAIDALDKVIEATDMGLPVDLIQMDFTHAWDLLGDITGESVQDELITQLFSQFCLGK